MPRRLRIQYHGAIYHLMARGNARQHIARDDDDHRRLQADLGRAVSRCFWKETRIRARRSTSSSEPSRRQAPPLIASGEINTYREREHVFHHVPCPGNADRRRSHHIRTKPFLDGLGMDDTPCGRRRQGNSLTAVLGAGTPIGSSSLPVRFNKECRKAGGKKKRLQTPAFRRTNHREATEVRCRLEPILFELSFETTARQPKRVVAA
jgi:hypothetical protein